jgi:hypothetical protein
VMPDTPATPQQGVAFAAKLIPEVERCFGETN